LVSASLTVIAVAGIGDPGFPNVTHAHTGITDPGRSKRERKEARRYFDAPPVKSH